jgi:hypothetical protein
MKWLKDNGAPQDKVELRTLEVPAAGGPQAAVSCCASERLETNMQVGQQVSMQPAEQQQEQEQQQRLAGHACMLGYW